MPARFHDPLMSRRPAAACQVFSGIDGTTGEYLRPSLAPRKPRRGTRRGLGHDDTLRRLHEVGWGVVFGSDVTGEQREALRPLLDLRRSQAGDLYREIEWVRPDVSARSFLERFSILPGPLDTRRMPYYVLLIGRPSELPFEFQHSLGVPCAVGRLAFDDAADYAAYARAVVEQERAAARPAARMLVFAPEHANDHPTQVASANLTRPLLEKLRVLPAPGWSVEARLGQEATQHRLLHALGGGDAAPQLLFFVGHGMAFWPDDPHQAALQGALVCADWPGATREGHPRRAPRAGEYVSAADLRAGRDMRGSVVFSVSCYSAGLPVWDSFERWISGRAVRRAKAPFVAALSRRLLGEHGALAVIGHVDSALLDGFLWPGVGSHTLTFERTLRQLMQGHTVGAAMEAFKLRLMHLRALLAEALESNDAWPGTAPPLPNPVPVRPLSPEEGSLWVAGNDARGYVVLGDPAVRLNVAGAPAPSGGRPRRVTRTWSGDSAV